MLPITSDLDRRMFGPDRRSDQVGYLDGALARFGRSYTGEPDVLATELAKDAAVAAADTILLTVPNQLGVEYNAAPTADDRPSHRAGVRLVARGVRDARPVAPRSVRRASLHL